MAGELRHRTGQPAGCAIQCAGRTRGPQRTKEFERDLLHKDRALVETAALWAKLVDNAVATLLQYRNAASTLASTCAIHLATDHPEG